MPGTIVLIFKISSLQKEANHSDATGKESKTISATKKLIIFTSLYSVTVASRLFFKYIHYLVEIRTGWTLLMIELVSVVEHMYCCLVGLVLVLTTNSVRLSMMRCMRRGKKAVLTDGMTTGTTSKIDATCDTRGTKRQIYII